MHCRGSARAMEGGEDLRMENVVERLTGRIGLVWKVTVVERMVGRSGVSADADGKRRGRADRDCMIVKRI